MCDTNDDIGSGNRNSRLELTALGSGVYFVFVDGYAVLDSGLVNVLVDITASFKQEQKDRQPTIEVVAKQAVTIIFWACWVSC